MIDIIRVDTLLLCIIRRLTPSLLSILNIKPKRKMQPLFKIETAFRVSTKGKVLKAKALPACFLF